MSRRGIQVGDQTRAFGIIIFICQIAFCFIYGFYSQYRQTSTMTDNDHILIVALILLTLVGFSLLFSYIKSAVFITIFHIIFIFAFSLQIFFMVKGGWDILDISQNPSKAQYTNKVIGISLINNNNDRQNSQNITQSSFADFLPCFLSLVISYAPLIGRVGHLQVLFLTSFGTIIYELNSQLFWRWFITDCGFGMRTFLFGGTLGLFVGIFLCSRQSTKDHPRYASDEVFQKLSLIGYVIIWCFFPFLLVSSLLHNPSIGSDSYIIYTAIFNMWLALCSSAIGSFSACLLMYQKFAIKQLVFTGFSGAIAFSSSVDLVFNPAYPIAIGTLTSFFCGILHTLVTKKINKKGILDSSGALISFIIPGLVSGIVSAIIQGVGAQGKGKYIANSNSIQKPLLAAFQMLGIGTSIGLGFGLALVLGFLFVFFNIRDRYEQFSYRHYIQIKQENEGSSYKQQ